MNRPLGPWPITTPSPDPRVRYLAPKLAELHLGAAGPAAEPSHRTCNPFRLEQRNRSLYMDEKILRLASKLSRYRKKLKSSTSQLCCTCRQNESLIHFTHISELWIPIYRSKSMMSELGVYMHWCKQLMGDWSEHRRQTNKQCHIK